MPIPDWVAHLATAVISALASVIALYVANQVLKLKEWFRVEMTKVVKENCAGRVEFNAHVAADNVFQETVLNDIDKSGKAGETILAAKFETVKTQVAAVGQRVDHLTALVESRLR